MIFKSIISERYRDVAEEVRATVIANIGKWVGSMPEKFLENYYLKFVAWALSDKVRFQGERSVDYGGRLCC